MTGIKNRLELLVDQDHTAKKLGSGELEVFATPAMIALIEETCWKSVADEVGEGNGTVGIKLDVSHLAATPVGMKVWCESELVSEEGRKLTFSVKVYDEAGLIGEGTHERFIVNNDKFMTKAEGKKMSH
jgi:predicted thioesterase